MKNYDSLLKEVAGYLAQARKASARAVNSVMTATYWLIGRRIVEFEQGGKERAEYGETLLERLSADLSPKFGRGFSRFNLGRFRDFYLAYPADSIRATLSLKSNHYANSEVPQIAPTVSAQSSNEMASQIGGNRISWTSSGILPSEKSATVSRNSSWAVVPKNGILQTMSAKSKSQTLSGLLTTVAAAFSLSWSHYVRLLSVENPSQGLLRGRGPSGVGASGNWTGRFQAFSTSARPCPRTRRPCSARAGRPNQGRKPLPRRSLRTPICWSSLA